MGCGCSIKGNGNVEKPEHPTANQAQPVADVMPRPGVMVSPWSDWSLRAGAELEPLLECTTLVCVRWLVKLGERGGVIPAWQNLPAEAKVSIDDLRSSVGRVEGGPYGLYYGLPVLVLSYPWWTQRHPDPEGAQLRMLLPIFRAIVANLDSMDESMRLTWGVVWDFCAFPQRGYSARPGRDSALTDGEDRSEEEVSRFRAGLSSVNVWYMHPYVWTLLVDTPITDASATYKQPYRERGWPTFERSVAALVKNMANLLSLERYIAAEMPNWLSIVEGCRAGRAAPLAPPAFSAMMRNAVGSGALRVTNGSDVEERLIPQYELGFKRAYSTPWIREMWYSSSGEASWLTYRPTNEWSNNLLWSARNVLRAFLAGAVLLYYIGLYDKSTASVIRSCRVRRPLRGKPIGMSGRSVPAQGTQGSPGRTSTSPSSRWRCGSRTRRSRAAADCATSRSFTWASMSFPMLACDRFSKSSGFLACCRNSRCSPSMTAGSVPNRCKSSPSFWRAAMPFRHSMKSFWKIPWRAMRRSSASVWRSDADARRCTSPNNLT
ncbi:unnamed protein product [Prorocentrum cordatum]|uniref:Uncharacterized protein n=1 Tax=Prorocentrum cordatum TaxID=2364126 RepID=A0ABN9U630_9DINO|nr:unnamed protein product [Polarella glacialis]